MNFYVYYSYEEWGRGYIGSRKCDCKPENDTKYFGSYYDPDFSPTNKIIIKQFLTQEEAIECEIALHDFFQVGINPHFANQSKQRRNGFYYNKSGEEHYGFGKPCPEHSERMKGQGNPMYGKRGEKSPHFGKKRPEHSRKMSGEGNPQYGKSREEIFGVHDHSGENHPFFGKKRPGHSATMKGRKRWVNAQGERLFQVEDPGEGWQRGIKWDPQK
jgi:hypothetical protein